VKAATNVPTDSRQLAAFFVLAFGISWSIGVPLALTQQGIIPAILPQWTHYLVAYGPMVSALIVTGISQGVSGLKDLTRRMVRLSCPKWWFVSLSPLLIALLIILIMNLLTGNQIRLSSLGTIKFLPPLGIQALLLWFFTFGLGEETGWRGFALPRLQKDRSALAATMILTVFWALWHLPQFFYSYDPTMIFGWLFGLFAGAVILTWLYNSANNSILIVAVWHACFNFVTASQAEIGLLPAVMSMLVIVLALVVIVFAKPKYLMSL
jgi:membrane protease YdiL (CAAX protease family)